MTDRYYQELQLVSDLWDLFLRTTVALDAEKETIAVDVLSETMKVLMNPYMNNSEKVLLLTTIQ